MQLERHASSNILVSSSNVVWSVQYSPLVIIIQYASHKMIHWASFMLSRPHHVTGRTIMVVLLLIRLVWIETYFLINIVLLFCPIILSLLCNIITSLIFQFEALVLEFKYHCITIQSSYGWFIRNIIKLFYIHR